MSRTQTHVTLPPHVGAVLESLAERSHLTKSEVVRQSILLLNAVVTDNDAANDWIGITRSTLGMENHNG